MNYQAHAKHYTSFVRSREDNTQWFYVNATFVKLLFILYGTPHTNSRSLLLVQSLPVKRKVSPNQNCEHQQKFFSTKKQRTNYDTCTTLSKPSLPQLQEIKITLEKEHPRYCGSCLKEEDKNATGIIPRIIQCDLCLLWIHLSCTILKLTTSHTNSLYLSFLSSQLSIL